MRRLLSTSWLVLPIVLSLFGNARAQVHQDWIHTFNAEPLGFDYAWSVARASSGDVYVAGTAASSLPDPAPDCLTLKYDAAGNLLWSRRFDLAGGTDEARRVVLEPSNGGVYSVGTGEVAGENKGLVLAYDAAGNLAWSATYPSGAGVAWFRSALRTADGKLVAAGFAVQPAGDSDVLVAEFDNAGNLLWSNTVGGSLQISDSATMLALDPSGEILVGGRINATSSTAGIGIAKFSTSGTQLWTREIHGTANNFDDLKALVVANDGSIYAAGELIDSATSGNAALIKLDPAGNVLWTRVLTGTSPNPSNGLNAIAVLQNGNVCATGATWQFDGQADLEVVQYTAAGNLVWRQSWDGATHYDDIGRWISAEPNGSITVGAVTRVTGTGKYDLALLRWSSQGTLRWSSVTPLTATLPTNLFDGSFPGDGWRVFSGRTDPTPGSPTDVVVLLERDQALPFCFGDGSGATCPCGNDSVLGQGRGCTNSLGDAAQLYDTGRAVLSSDTLVLTSAGELPTALSILLQGTTSISPVAFGDGLLCLGGSLKRLYAHNAIAGVVSVPSGTDVSISTRSAALGNTITAGSTRTYQMYYRDASAGFCAPPAGNSWNASSGLSVIWSQ